jgi:hypothetical protein
MSSKCIGWACSDALAGDEIYILEGCSVPILRLTGSNGGRVVVEEAYIRDVMRGDFLKGKERGRIAIHRYYYFIIHTPS